MLFLHLDNHNSEGLPLPFLMLSRKNPARKRTPTERGAAYESGNLEKQARKLIKVINHHFSVISQVSLKQDAEQELGALQIAHNKFLVVIRRLEEIGNLDLLHKDIQSISSKFDVMQNSHSSSAPTLYKDLNVVSNNLLSKDVTEPSERDYDDDHDGDVERHEDRESIIEEGCIAENTTSHDDQHNDQQSVSIKAVQSTILSINQDAPDATETYFIKEENREMNHKKDEMDKTYMKVGTDKDLSAATHTNIGVLHDDELCTNKSTENRILSLSRKPSFVNSLLSRSSITSTTSMTRVVETLHNHLLTQMSLMESIIQTSNEPLLKKELENLDTIFQRLTDAYIKLLKSGQNAFILDIDAINSAVLSLKAEVIINMNQDDQKASSIGSSRASFRKLPKEEVNTQNVATPLPVKFRKSNSVISVSSSVQISSQTHVVHTLHN